MSLEGVAEVFAEETFEWGGKQYKLTRPNLVTEVAIRKYLEAEEGKRIDLHRAIFSPEAWSENWSGWRKDCTAGIWAYGMPDCYNALRNPEHFAQFIWLILTQADGQENITVATTEKMLSAHRYRKPDGTFGNHIAEKVDRLLSVTPTIPPEVGEQAKP